MPDTTVVHLLRHGEVSNPSGVLYGRLPGFHLSPEGEHMAKAAAAFLAGRDVTLLLSSPLERALETAAPVAAQFGLEVRVDDRLVEPWNHFQGERYASIEARMQSVMTDAEQKARGHEAVLVSHQLAIWVARRSAEKRRLWHHPARRECALGSVTSFTYRDDVIVGISYAEPAGHRGGDHGA